MLDEHLESVGNLPFKQGRAFLTRVPDKQTGQRFPNMQENLAKEWKQENRARINRNPRNSQTSPKLTLQSGEGSYLNGFSI